LVLVEVREVKNFCRLTKNREIFGYSYESIRSKIYSGRLIEGKHFFRDPDRRIVLDLDAFQAWIMGRDS